MSMPITSANHYQLPQQMQEFFLARQPILNRKQELFAYELLFRSAATGPASITNDLSATAAVIAHASHLGLERVIGNAQCFVNVDSHVLNSEIFDILPRERVVLEIIESVRATTEVLERVSTIRKKGFRFALDDVVSETPDVKALTPLADVIKCDLRDIPPSHLPALVRKFKDAGKLLLAEKVETRDQFETCKALGFDYFQGYYFARPVTLSGKKLSPSQLSLIQVLQLLGSDADDYDIQIAIKRDITLCFNLLRLVNSPAIGARQHIDSVSKALMILGRSQLRRWLQIMLYAEPCKNGEAITALLSLATTRGKLLELMAQQIDARDRNSSDTAFTVGIMSLMHALFNVPIEILLEQIHVMPEISEALLHREGRYGDMLAIAEWIEQMDDVDRSIEPRLARLQLRREALGPLQLAAFTWSDQVARDVP